MSTGITGQLAAALAMAAGAAAGLPAERGIDGAFIWPAWNPDWSQERWAEELAAMRALGMDTVIVAQAVNGTQALYTTQIPGRTSVGSDPLGNVLAEADATGMGVFLGLVLDGDWWSHTDAEFLDDLSSRSCAVADELFALYGGHPSLRGFYITPEIDNARWIESEPRTNLVEHFLQPICGHIKSLRSDLLVCQAPFYNPVFQQPAEHGAWWEAVLRDTPGLDIIIPQDGIGARPGVITPEIVTDYFRAYRAACDATSRELWADMEVFDDAGVNDAPRSFARVETQIATLDPLVGRIVVWEWAYIAPQHSVSALDFYTNCLRRRQGQAPLVCVSSGKACEVDPALSTPVRAPELTDGATSDEVAGQVEWLGDGLVTVTVDLGEVVPNLSDFRAFFLSSSAAGAPMPTSTTVAISVDGTDYQDLGSLTPVNADDGALKPCRLALTTPVEGRWIRFQATPSGGRLLCSEVSVHSEPGEPPSPSQTPTR